MDEYIKREAALMKLMQDGCSAKNLQSILDMPAADVEPVRRWIPVSERLPEELVSVNVVWVNKNPEPYYAGIKDIPFSGTAVFFGGRWYWESPVCVDMLEEYGRNEADLVDSGVKITHWMPLPEPPKMGGDAEDAV